uniref:Amino acid transporter n=1 Tax=Gongylonema pulchrum TaxID=637853 RepID=A0A183DUR1_9BILA
LTAINCMSVRLATFVQDFFTVAKLFALCLIIGTGAILLVTGKPQYRESFENIFENTTPDIGTASLAFYSGLFAYQGWNYLNFIVEELQNPRRLFYVGAREGHMPVVLTMINKRTRTPIPAVIFTGLLSMAYLTLSRDVFSLINYIQIVYWLAIGCAIAALFWLRKKMPDAERPIKGLLSMAYLTLSRNVFSLINYIQIVYWLAIGCAIAALFWLRKKMPDAERPIKVNLIFPTLFFLGCVALVIIPIIGSPKDTGLFPSQVQTFFLLHNFLYKPHYLQQSVLEFYSPRFLFMLFLSLGKANQSASMQSQVAIYSLSK